MSIYTKRHYESVADTINDWIKINKGVSFNALKGIHPEIIHSLIDGFILTFKADNNKFDYRKFINAINNRL